MTLIKGRIGGNRDPEKDENRAKTVLGQDRGFVIDKTGAKREGLDTG